MSAAGTRKKRRRQRERLVHARFIDTNALWPFNDRWLSLPVLACLSLKIECRYASCAHINISACTRSYSISRVLAAHRFKIFDRNVPMYYISRVKINWRNCY